MPFKGTILDFYKNYSSHEFNEVNILEVKDPFWAKLLNDCLRKSQGNLCSRWGEDLTEEWVNETWFDLSLFADTNSYFIYNTESSSKKVLELITKIEHPSEKIFLHFAKEPKGFSKSLSGEFNIFQVKEFSFWELDKLLEFFGLILEKSFSPAIRQYFSNWTIERKREIYDQLNYLSLVYEDVSKISLEQINDVLSTGDLNPFTLSDYLSQRRIKSLYSDLLENLRNDNWASSHKVVTFLRSFVLKSTDTKYSEKKSKLNTFDKKILAVQQSYPSKELSSLLKDLSHWEIQIKRKDKSLLKDLQSRLIDLV